MSYHTLSKAILVLAFLFVFIGAFAPKVQATTVEELQAQISALLAQLAQLQQQLADLQGGGTAWCHTFNQGLRFGDTGTEVTALQTALQKEGLYDRTINGDFDEYTASAVVAFQEKYYSEILAPLGLKNGTGYVGPSTRAKLNALYGCGVVTTPSITVLSPNGGETWVTGNTYQITWRSTSGSGLVTADKLEYVKIILIFPTGLAPDHTIASYIPTYSNIINSYSWDPGSYLNTFEGFSEGGGYKIKIANSLSVPNVSDTSDSTFSIISEFGMGKNLPPVIDGLTAPSQLKVSETGTWIIKAHDPENGVLSYSVDWGDTKLTPLSASGTGTQTTTFTHSYSQIGTYTVTFTITDDKYQIAKTTTTVQVVSTTTPYIQVLSPNGGEQWQIGKTYDITWNATNVLGKFQIMLHRNYSSDTSSWGMTVASNLSNDTRKYSWIVPSYVEIGSNYQIEVQEMTSNLTALTSGMVRDFSDNYFTIVATAPTCTDSDNGQDFYIKGTTKKVSGSSTSTYYDQCLFNTNKVHEWYCDSADNPKTIDFECPYGCSDGACKPGITVTSPNGGEKWTKGNTYDVTWKSSGVDKITVDLFVGVPEGTESCKTSVNIANYVSASLGRYSFTVPSDMCTSNYYKVKISTALSTESGTTPIDLSDNYFTIVAATTTCTDSDGGENIYLKGTVKSANQGGTDCCAVLTSADPRPSCTKFITGKDEGNAVWEYICKSTGEVIGYLHSCPSGYTCQEGACVKSSITVTSPNGGEKWIAGQTYNITWNSAGVERVNIDIWGSKSALSGSDELVNVITGNLASTGYYKWTIPSNIKVYPYYKVEILDQQNGVPLDKGDGYFTIVATAPTCTDSDNGQDFYIKGTTKKVSGSSTSTYYDQCLFNTNKVHEWYCDSADNPKTIDFECPYGCSDGACKPGITVTSPNGGESYIIGSGYLYIKYKVSNIPIGTEVTAYLKKFPAGNTTRTSSGTVENYEFNTLSMNMELASSEEPGQYKIEICGKVKDTEVCDISDNYFSIVEAPSGSLSVVKSEDMPSGQTYSKGTVDAKLLKIALTAGSVEDIKISKVAIEIERDVIDTFKLLQLGDLTNIKLWRDGVQLGSTISTAAGTTFSTPTVTFYADLIVPKNTTTTLTLSANISSTTTAISFESSILSTYISDWVTSTGVTSGKDIIETGGASNIVNIVAATPTCTDSDSGLNYYLKGTISGTNISPDTATDDCVYIGGKLMLVERYCADGKGATVDYECSYGCSDGACKKGITVLSPNGGETFGKGQIYDITWKSSGIDNVHIELINADYTYEIANVSASSGKYSWTIGSQYPNRADYKIRIFTYPVPSSQYWQEGVTYDRSDNYFTILAAMSVCTDSDNGKDYSKKGLGAGWGGLENDYNWKYFGDQCYQNNSAVTSCSGTGCYLTEYYCSESYYVKSENYTCLYGCEDGACKSGTTSMTDIQNQLASVQEQILQLTEKLKQLLGR